MKIIVNGNEINLETSRTIADFIIERKVTGTMFAIEKNMEIINKEDYASTELNEGDKIELVGFVGGG